MYILVMLETLSANFQDVYVTVFLLFVLVIFFFGFSLDKLDVQLTGVYIMAD